MCICKAADMVHIPPFLLLFWMNRIYKTLKKKQIGLAVHKEFSAIHTCSRIGHRVSQKSTPNRKLVEGEVVTGKKYLTILFFIFLITFGTYILSFGSGVDFWSRKIKFKFRQNLNP